jgi:hypothetical protein
MSETPNALDEARDTVQDATHNAWDYVQDSVHNCQEQLPEQFRFLNSGWWAVHLLAIPLLVAIGYMLGQRRA